MNLKLLACLACSAALLLGACSSNNTSGPSNAGGGTDTGGSGTDTGGSGTDTGGNGNAATGLEAAAKTAVDRAINAATQAAAGTGDRAAARRSIVNAENALETYVEDAELAYTRAQAAPNISPADLARAANAKDDAIAYQKAQTVVLNGWRARLSWFGGDLVRQTLARGAVINPGEGANTADIERIPRTKDTSATDDTQIANTGNTDKTKDAFTDMTFKTIPYAAGKEVFSNSGDEFKVDGYVMIKSSVDSLDTTIYTGLKLTNEGLVIRTGGTDSRSGSASQYTGDFTDMRRKITTWESDGDGDGDVDTNDGISGQNGWDLAITLDEPKYISPSGNYNDISSPISSWTGNDAYYWRSLVPAAPSQKSGGTYYDAGAFINQPADQENLGWYEVWLSNAVGVNLGAEPATPGATVICPNGSSGTTCPDDDVYRYLSYAAYGLFVYSADDTTFIDGDNFNGQLGRINTIHFGYSAFANENGQKTTDIGEAITNGTFLGQTLAYEVTGSGQDLPVRSKLLRGDVRLTVSIPKGSGTTALQGTMNNFQKWSEDNFWTAYTENFTVTLESTTISDDGTFAGDTRATPITGLDGVGFTAPENTYASGVFKGSFYGPRANKNDLEIAGSWTVGSEDTEGNTDLYGSFGAKQDTTSR